MVGAAKIPTPADQPGGLRPQVVELSSRWFVACALLLSALVAAIGCVRTLPAWLLITEVFALVAGLFLLGSFRYQVRKNVLTFGWLPLLTVTFALSQWQARAPQQALWAFVRDALHKIPLSWAFLDELLHADTLLFIAALSLLVSAIAQTRTLESIALRLVYRFSGRVFVILLILSGVVAATSGVLGGVSMVGLLIRTMVILLMLAGAPLVALRKTVLFSTLLTTICGIWLSYGEPPNLIMAANVLDAQGRRVLSDQYFLTYCLPAALLAFAVLAWELRRVLQGVHIDLAQVDLLEKNAATLRFSQAMRLGRVLTEVELLDEHSARLGAYHAPVLAALQAGHSVGDALVGQHVPAPLRQFLLGQWVGIENAAAVDAHFVARAQQDTARAQHAASVVSDALRPMALRRVYSRRWGAVGLLVFVALLVLHSATHVVPLFVPPLLGFVVAVRGLYPFAHLRTLVLAEALHEIAEYLFLIPLFVAVSFLTWSGFFQSLAAPMQHSIDTLGRGPVALQQFGLATVLSAVLDNNIVADFASRLIATLPQTLVFLFSTAQIAGYALGGCWTHVGSAQSVVAFAFLKRDIDPTYTPVQWLWDITFPIVRIGLLLAAYLWALAQIVT